MRQGGQGRQGDKETRRQGDKETRRTRETRRQGDKETRRQGRNFNHAIPQNKVVRLLGIVRYILNLSPLSYFSVESDKISAIAIGLRIVSCLFSANINGVFTTMTSG